MHVRALRYLSSSRMASWPRPKKPLVAVIGATGTGKSDLAVEIARRYNGEIINGDAMQLYHGLPIITNKITQDEMKGVPHHLLGCIGLEEETWTVGKFVNNALGVIDKIRSRGKLPILVGGTHYYTQALLFKETLSEQPFMESGEKSQQFPILDEPTESILARLREVDPVMADRWHPNDRRKIQRSLEIYLRTGKPASQVYEEQRVKGEISSNTANIEEPQFQEEDSGLRFPTLLFWVHASKDILQPRLDGRIVRMLDKGLLDEVRTLYDFRQSYEARTGRVIDQTRGIWVSIGYKEFLDYHSGLLEEDLQEQSLEKVKATAVEKTQAATRQYANRQLRWIRIKFLNALFQARQQGNIFLLDGSDLSNWSSKVVQPAAEITEKFLSAQELPQPTSLSELATEMLNPKRDYDLSQRPDLWQKKVCETCGTVSVTENDWTQHVKSRAHRRAVGIKKKQLNTGEAGPKASKSPQEDMIDVLEGYQQQLSEKEEP